MKNTTAYRVGVAYIPSKWLICHVRHGINVHPIIVSSIRMCIDFITGARSFSKNTMMFSLLYYYVLNKVYISLLSINVAFKCYVKLSYHTQIKCCNCFIILHFTNFNLCPDINPCKIYYNNMSLYNFRYFCLKIWMCAIWCCVF